MTQALEDDSTTLIIPGPDEIAIKLEPLALSNLHDSEDRKYFNTFRFKPFHHATFMPLLYPENFI